MDQKPILTTPEEILEYIIHRKGRCTNVECIRPIPCSLNTVPCPLKIRNASGEWHWCLTNERGDIATITSNEERMQRAKEKLQALQKLKWLAGL